MFVNMYFFGNLCTALLGPKINCFKFGIYKIASSSQLWLNIHQFITRGLFIAEHIWVKVVDYICCNKSADQSNGPSDQNSHIVGAGRVVLRGSFRAVPIWGPVVTWKHKGWQIEFFSTLVSNSTSFSFKV